MGLRWGWIWFWGIALFWFYIEYDARGFNREFCKVEFLCYAGQPNWLGSFVNIGLSALLGHLIFRTSYRE